MNLFKNHILFFVLVSSLSGATNAFASNGVGSGGGGDPDCQEFYALASQISVTFAKIGQAKIDTVNRLINVDTLRAKVMAPLNVTPDHNLPRLAISEPTADATRLDVDQWKPLSRAKKIKNVVHELMVLTRAEGDGEYAVSNDGIKILVESNAFPDLESENSIVIDQPKANEYLISNKSSPDSVCLRLGYTKAVDKEFAKVYFGLNNPITVAKLRNDGHLDKLLAKDYDTFGDQMVTYYKSIVCTR